MHMYAPYNPIIKGQDKSQIKWTVYIWGGGIINGHLIGPVFFDRPLNSLMYLQFLENDLPELLAGLPNHVTNNMTLSVFIDDKEIERVDFLPFLRIHIDDRLD